IAARGVHLRLGRELAATQLEALVAAVAARVAPVDARHRQVRRGARVAALGIARRREVRFPRARSVVGLRTCFGVVEQRLIARDADLEAIDQEAAPVGTADLDHVRVLVAREKAGVDAVEALDERARELARLDRGRTGLFARCWR